MLISTLENNEPSSFAVWFWSPYAALQDLFFVWLIRQLATKPQNIYVFKNVEFTFLHSLGDTRSHGGNVAFLLSLKEKIVFHGTP